MPELLENLKKGQPAAVRELLENTATPVYRFLYRFLGERVIALEILTDVYLELLKSLVDVRDDRELTASLWKSAHRLATKKAFALASAAKAPRASASRKAGPPAFLLSTRSEALRKLQNAWAELDVPYREALALAGIEPLLPYEETSGMLEGSQAILRNRLAYALRALLKSV